LAIERKKYNRRTANVIINFSTEDGDQLELDLSDLGINRLHFKVVNCKEDLKNTRHGAPTSSTASATTYC